MTAFPHRVIESFTRVTPFGARFWDPATRRFIGEGLRLRAGVAGTAHGRTVEGFPNPGGVFLLAGLPGLRDAENGAGDPAYWETHRSPASPPQNLYRMEVSDPAGRFLPYAFAARLPFHGLFEVPHLALPSPPTSPPAERIAGLPLFCAPSRPVPAGLAVVRAQLRDLARGRPASWARIDVHCQGRLASIGMADAEGRVALYFAYPEPVPKLLARASPPPPVPESTWTVRLEAFYSPPAQDARPPAMPDLNEFLGQPPATLLATTSPPAAIGGLQLHRGVELVVRSAGSSCLYL